MGTRPFLLAALLAAGCATSSGPDVDQPGVVDQGLTWVVFRGSGLAATVGYADARGNPGDRWLILAAELTGAGGPPAVHRDGISVRAPDGRRLGLISQDAYLEVYPELRVRVRQALANLPRRLTFDDAQRPCDRWFLAGPFESFAFGELYLNAFTACEGPLVFAVPGGVQPGRWRLVVEMTEARADIPFSLGVAD
jgi:hypothetical protein